MAKEKRRINDSPFSNYKITLTIILVTILILLFTYNFTHNWKVSLSPLNLSIPLLVLFIKLEHDDTQAKNEKVLVSRNYLLAYLIELDDISKHFGSMPYIESIPDINDLENKVHDYSDIEGYIDSIKSIIRVLESNMTVIKERENVHGDLKNLLGNMLKQSNIIYTDSEYDILSKLQYAYVFQQKTNLDSLTETINSFDAMLKTKSRYSEDELLDEWHKFVKSANTAKLRIHVDDEISKSVNELIQILEIYNPNSKV